jgi:hypothetical protein
MKSWKTTLAGAVSALGVYLTNATGVPEWLHIVGQVLQGAGVFLLGTAARDNNKSSEAVGAQ